MPTEFLTTTPALQKQQDFIIIIYFDLKTPQKMIGAGL